MLRSNIERGQQEPEYPGANRDRASVCVVAVTKALIPEVIISVSSCLKEVMMAFFTRSSDSLEDC